MTYSVQTTYAQAPRMMLVLPSDATGKYENCSHVSTGMSCKEMQACFASQQRKHDAHLEVAGIKFNSEDEGGAYVRSRNP